MFSHIVLVSFLVLLIFFCIKYKESFINVILVEDNTIQDIIFPINDYDTKLIDLIKLLPEKFKYNTYSTKSTDLYYNDIMGFQNDQSYIVAVTDDKKYALFLKDVSTFDDGDITNLKNGKIGYVEDKDLVILKTILFGCGIDSQYSSFVKFSTIEEANNALFVNKSVKSLFLFQNLKNPKITNVYKDVKLGMYSFERLSEQKIRVLLPHASVIDYDFGDVFAKFIDKSTVKRTLSFDNVIFCRSQNSTYLLDYVIRLFEKNYDSVNYYAQSYAIHPRTLKLYRGKDEFAMKVESRSILEQYTEDNGAKTLHLVPKDYLFGYYDGDDNTFTFNDISLEGTPLRIGDVVELNQQKRAIENSVYVVKIVNKEKNITVMKNIRPYKPVSKVVDQTDPRYICSDPNIKIKGLCESKFDTTGKTKLGNRPDIWDRPCDFDQECPFFQKNKNYQNYRGGCLDGYCELPVGLHHKGFRNFKGTPLCHSCENPNDPECCEKQKYPDYAFELDEFERLPKIVEMFEQDPTRNALFGDYYNVSDKNVYHYEDTNNIVDSKLQVLKNELVSLQDAHVDIPKFLLNSFQTVDQDYRVYDVAVALKNTNDDETMVKYDVFCTLYRDEKSHGKRVNVLFTNNLPNKTVSIDDIRVIGVIPQNEINVNVLPKGYDENLSYEYGKKCFKAGISSDSIFEIDNSKTYLCDRSKKLKEDYNLDVDCSYSG